MLQWMSITSAFLLVVLCGACRLASTIVAASSVAGIAPVVPSVPSHYRPFRGLVVERTDIVSRFPLLPYVFFDVGSGAIPKRYDLFTDPDQTTAFNDSAFGADQIAWHHQVLNVIGYRMKKYPAASISIVGCNADQPGRGEGLGISERRARVIADYLTGIWGVDPSRITVLPPRNLPAHSTPGNTPAADAENRRADIASSDYDIMKPVVARESRRLALPDSVWFRLRNPIPDSLIDVRWIEIRRNDSLWVRLENIGRGDTLSPGYNWGRKGNRDSLPDDERPFVAQLVVRDIEGEEYRSDTAVIPVEIVDQAKRIRTGRLHEVAEDFMFLALDTAGAGPIAARFIRESMAPIVDSTSTIEVIGYGDFPSREIGRVRESAARARRNSDMMADALRRGLATRPARILILPPRVDPLFRGETPEDRFYYRVVSIRVITPAGPVSPSAGSRSGG